MKRLTEGMPTAASSLSPTPTNAEVPLGIDLKVDGVLAAVGNTPLVRLARLFPDADFELYAKLEALNPGGSIKDRPALNMLVEALRAGRMGPDTTVVESSSGNLAIGLAQVCAYLGLRLICVVDTKTPKQTVRLLTAYGATVDVVTKPDSGTGEYLPARLRRVRELLRQQVDAFWPNQYENLDNPRAHHQTMDEIVVALEGRVDYVFCSTSTCGTLRGCAEYVRSRGMPTRLVAVDAVGSVIFGSVRRKRLIPGHGAGIKPPLCEAADADEVVHATDLECVVGCRSLVQREAILAGGSSGAAIIAVHKLRGRIASGARCVVVLPDRGERYLDTIFSDSWVKQNFGQVPGLLEARSTHSRC